MTSRQARKLTQSHRRGRKRRFATIDQAEHGCVGHDQNVTALLVASLVGGNPGAADSGADSKPSAPTSQSGKASAAPGAPAGGDDLSLAEAIANIPVEDEDRAGYERDSSVCGWTRTRTGAIPGRKS